MQGQTSKTVKVMFKGQVHKWEGHLNENRLDKRKLLPAALETGIGKSCIQFSFIYRAPNHNIWLMVL